MAKDSGRISKKIGKAYPDIFRGIKVSSIVKVIKKEQGISPKQTTRWYFRYEYINGYLRSGIVHHPDPKKLSNVRDIVRFQLFKDGKLKADWYLRPDEALAQATALQHAVGEGILSRKEAKRQKKD